MESRDPRRVRVFIPTSLHAVELVRGWSYPGIRSAIPVRPVVLRVSARPTVVRHFVVLESGRAERLIRREKLMFEDLFWRFLGVVTRDPAPERRVRLHREAVRRDVRQLQRKRRVEIPRPRAPSEFRNGEDQVNGNVSEARVT